MWSAVFRMPLCPAAKIQPESRHTTWHIVVTLSWCIMMCHDVVVGSGAWSVRHKRWLAPETDILKSNAQLEIWTPDRQWQVWQVTNPEKDMSATATPFFDQMLDFLTVCWLKWGSKHKQTIHIQNQQKNISTSKCLSIKTPRTKEEFVKMSSYQHFNTLQCLVCLMYWWNSWSALSNLHLSDSFNEAA